MSPVPDSRRHDAVLHTVAHPEPTVRNEVTLMIAGRQRDRSGVAELWLGSVLLGTMHEEYGALVLRLESHAGGPLAVDAVALERGLAEAREKLTVATSAGESSCVPMALADQLDGPPRR